MPTIGSFLFRNAAPSSQKKFANNLALFFFFNNHKLNYDIIMTRATLVYMSNYDAHMLQPVHFFIHYFFRLGLC